MSTGTVARANTYDVVTERILALLDTGTIPWRKPWNASIGLPMNIRGNAYSGVNRLLLGMAQYDTAAWLTYRQAVELGGHVRRGEHGWPVVFWKFGEQEIENPATGDPETKPWAILRHYTVFNFDQTEGIALPDRFRETLKHRQPIIPAENIASGYHDAPEIHHGGDRAYYRPSTDTVTIPPSGAFVSSEAYYDTLFHELGHSTGHPSRLARKGITDIVMFGDHNYAQEELVAEISAAFLCEEAGISRPVLENNAAYIASWLLTLGNDRRMVVLAAAQAQKAASRILGSEESGADAEDESPAAPRTSHRY